MIALYDHIQELRAELRGCYMTRRGRAAPLFRPSSPTRSPTKPNSTARSISPSRWCKTEATGAA